MSQVAEQLHPLQRCAGALSELDVLCAFADRALHLNFQAPELTEDNVLIIEEGRHPVVEQISTAPFVPNDLMLTDDHRMLIITGPNMGKIDLHASGCTGGDSRLRG